jgi:hypothetical protein
MIYPNIVAKTVIGVVILKRGIGGTVIIVALYVATVITVSLPA